MHPELMQRLLRDTNPVGVLVDALVIASHLARVAKEGGRVGDARAGDASAAGCWLKLAVGTCPQTEAACSSSWVGSSAAPCRLCIQTPHTS
jgi:hypothetical protein